MVENFELNKKNAVEDTTSNALAEEIEQIKRQESGLKPEAAMEAARNREFNEAVEAVMSIAQRIMNLPENLRSEFVASIGDMQGPAYDMIRKSCGTC